MAYTPLVTYTMIGYQTSAGSTPGQAVVWNVTGTPDLTGAKSPFPNAIYNISINATTVSPPPNTNVQTPTGPAGGDLGGYYPNPTVIAVQGNPITSTTPTDGAVLTYNADEQELFWVVPESGDVTFAGDLSGNDSTQTVVGIQNTPVVAGTVVDGYVLTVNPDGYYEPLPPSGGGIPDPGGEENGDILFYQGGTWNLRHIGTSGYVLTSFEGSPTWEPYPELELFSGGIPQEATTTLGVDGTTISLTTVSGIPTLSAISSGSNATELQSVPVSSATPTDGYVLGYNGSEWLAVPQTGGGGSSNIPSYVYPLPPSASSFTTCGNIGVSQAGSFILAKSLYTESGDQSNEVFLPIPGGVNPAGPWVAVVSLAGNLTYESEYPSFGIVVSNGTTQGASTELFVGTYQELSNPCLGVWTAIAGTQTRPDVIEGDNSLQFHWPMAQAYFRIICDGTNIITQYSKMGGYHWLTSYSNTIASFSLGTLSNYGVQLGSYSGSGTGAVIITGLSMSVMPQLSIASISSASGSVISVQTTTPHGLTYADDVSITGVPSGASAANGVYINGTVIVTGADTFNLNLINSISTETSGTVTILSQP